LASIQCDIHAAISSQQARSVSQPGEYGGGTTRSETGYRSELIRRTSLGRQCPESGTSTSNVERAYGNVSGSSGIVPADKSAQCFSIPVRAARVAQGQGDRLERLLRLPTCAVTGRSRFQNRFADDGVAPVSGRPPQTWDWPAPDPGCRFDHALELRYCAREFPAAPVNDSSHRRAPLFDCIAFAAA
jgi:hypothetical protein